MPVKAKYPPAALTQTPTPDLEVLPPALSKEHQLGTHRVSYDKECPMPEYIGGFTDGHRFFINSLGNERYVENSYIIYFYILGIVGLFISILTFFGEGEGDVDTSIYFILAITNILLIYAIIVSIIKNKSPITNFIVFDRDSGNVLFAKRRSWPNLVVPFERVGLFTDHSVGRGGMHFIAKFDCQMRPKGKRGRRMEFFMPGELNNFEQTQQQWAYINRFMDKSKPFPREPAPTWAGVEWFRERNITMDDVMKKNGYVVADPETNWFKWDDSAPINQSEQNKVEIGA